MACRRQWRWRKLKIEKHIQGTEGVGRWLYKLARSPASTEKLGEAGHTCNPSTRRAETGGPLRISHHPEGLLSSRFSKRHEKCDRKASEKAQQIKLDKPSSISRPTWGKESADTYKLHLDLHMHTYTHIPLIYVKPLQLYLQFHSYWF